jgi:hypothetical protein
VAKGGECVFIHFPMVGHQVISTPEKGPARQT